MWLWIADIGIGRGAGGSGYTGLGCYKVVSSERRARGAAQGGEMVRSSGVGTRDHLCVARWSPAPRSRIYSIAISVKSEM